MIPKSTLGRVAKTRRAKNGQVLREWFYTGISSCAVTRDPSLGIVDVTFTIPLDVPSKPRTTQNSTWLPSFQNYMNWRDMYRGAIYSALRRGGIELGEHIPRLPEDALFWSSLSHEPKTKKSRKVYTAPLVVSGVIVTKFEGDTDNRIKAVLDGSNGVLWPDDRSVAWPSFLVLPAQNDDASCVVRVQYVPLENRRQRLLARANNFPSFWEGPGPQKGPDV